MVTNGISRAIALGYLSAIGALFFNTQPVLVGVFSDAFGFDEQQLGFVLSAGLIGSFVVLCSSYFWIHRVPFRPTVGAGILLAVAAQGLLLIADSFVTVVAATLLFGAAVAVSYAPVIVQIGRGEQAARDFGVSITLQVLVAGVSLVLIPGWLAAEYGLAGVVGLFLVVLVTGFVVLGFVREKQRPDDARLSVTTAAKPALICLFAMTVFFFGLNGTWAFIESFGMRLSFDRADIGYVLSVALFAGVMGSMTASVLPRLKLHIVQLLSYSGFVLAAWLLLSSPGIGYFAVGVIAFNVAWNFSLPFLMALMATVDTGGRYLSLLPAAQTLGGAIGPALAGSLFVGPGPLWVTLQLLACVLAAFFLFLLVTPVHLAIQKRNSDAAG